MCVTTNHQNSASNKRRHVGGCEQEAGSCIAFPSSSWMMPMKGKAFRLKGQRRRARKRRRRRRKRGNRVMVPIDTRMGVGGKEGEGMKGREKKKDTMIWKKVEKR